MSDVPEMVERVARRLYEVRRRNVAPLAALPPWEEIDEARRAGWLDEAREVFEEIREPTEAMLAAGNVFLNANPTGAGLMWRAMNDTALTAPSAPARK